ncbi:acetylcholine receptor subunit alpha-like 1 [Tubulanus polymorphus]|uniref:acetylcholine receptor subunit alpha-like 1 n=1 Tax=Tubulanus polymorphus TaxID=672921 RepID=UPI003DA47EC7
MDDGGTYKCRSLLGGVTTEAQKELFIYKKITWDDCPREQRPAINQDGLIRCVVSGSPAPQVMWSYRKNENSPRRPIIIGDRYQIDNKGLSIKNMTEADNGIYTCTAEVELTGDLQQRAITVELHNSKGAPDEFRLIDDLLGKHYSAIKKYVRPVKDVEDAVTVKIGFSLIHIDQVDVENSVASFNGWLDLEWNDFGLRWDPKEYGGIRLVRLPTRYIWTPDIEMYNSGYIGNVGGLVKKTDTLAMVSHDGTVFWAPPVRLISLFGGVDDKNIALCKVKLGSWTYDGNKVDVKLRSQNIDVSNYRLDKRYSLLALNITRNEITYSCCPEPFPDISLEFKIEIKS